MKKRYLLFILIPLIPIAIFALLRGFGSLHFDSINDPSMEPGLLPGARLMMTKHGELKRGSLVAVEIDVLADWNPEGDIEEGKIILYRRLLGIPGDQIQFDYPRLIINGSQDTSHISLAYDVQASWLSLWETQQGELNSLFWESSSESIVYLDEKYGKELSEKFPDFIGTQKSDTKLQNAITLGEEQYFVLADNRDWGLDSRNFGAINRDQILYRVLSYDQDLEQAQWHRLKYREKWLEKQIEINN
jgi:type IV secretory pathway protease TraF